MRNFRDPMWILSVAVLLGVIGMGVATLLREDQQMSAEEIALLSAIVGAVAGSSLPRSARGDDEPKVVLTDEVPDAPVVDPDGADPLAVEVPGYVGIDPGIEDGGEPEYGTDDDDWFDDEPDDQRPPA